METHPMPNLAKLLIAVLAATLVSYILNTIFNTYELFGSTFAVYAFLVVRILLIAWMIFHVATGNRTAVSLILIITAISCIFTFLDIFAAENLVKELLSYQLLETGFWVAATLIANSNQLKGWLIERPTTGAMNE